LKKGKRKELREYSNKRGEFVQSVLYASIELLND
jgi:hypothetical protein